MNEALLAEDEPVSRAFLAEALALLGWHCESFADGAAALDRARARRFDLLVLDLDLPHCRGPEVLAKLRADPDAASNATPALALTAELDSTLETALLAAGFACVGRKPIDLRTLAAHLAQAMGVSPTSDQDSPDPRANSIESSEVPRQPWGTSNAQSFQASNESISMAHPIWDDAIALRACGGQRDIVLALRELMRRELPTQRDTILTALDRGDPLAARNELHRLLAACGFCGAAALTQAVTHLHASLDADATARAAASGAFSAEVQRVLEAAQTADLR